MAHWSFFSRHLAHEGGSDPKEKNHIIASCSEKAKKDSTASIGVYYTIFLPFAPPNESLTTEYEMLKQSPGTVYVESHQGLMGLEKAGLNKDITYIRGQSSSH